jgi:hypothetical protein
MKLCLREIPAVDFTRELPAWLNADKPCRITFKARAGGAVNPAYMAGADLVDVKRAINVRRLNRIDSDTEFVAQERAIRAELGRDLFGVIYDTCIIEWETDILDDGMPMELTRDNFIELAAAKIPQIDAAMTDFRLAILQAASDAAEEDSSILKN